MTLLLYQTFCTIAAILPGYLTSVIGYRGIVAVGTLICATGFFLGSWANTLPLAIITLGFMIGIF